MRLRIIRLKFKRASRRFARGGETIQIEANGSQQDMSRNIFGLMRDGAASGAKRNASSASRVASS